MEKETVEGLRLGTVMILIAATLTVALLIFWYARQYSGKFFDSAAAQAEQAKSQELSALSLEGIMDVPLATMYTVIAREWRAVSEISVYPRYPQNNETLTPITTGVSKGTHWELSSPLVKADGTVVETLTAPEQILYAGVGGYLNSRVSGRAYVTVRLEEITMTYVIDIYLQQ